MFFTRLAYVLAWGAFLFGGAYTAYSYAFAIQLYRSTGRFLSEKGSESQAEGIMVMIFGIVLGAIMEALRRIAPPKD